MRDSLTLDGFSGRRVLSFMAGAGMMYASLLTIEHYFAANFPTSIWEGSICDINAFFNCDSSANSSISAVMGVPIGWLGSALGGLVALAALFPSDGIGRTVRSLAALNVIGVVSLLVYSVFVLGSLCLLCSGYYVFSFVALWLVWRAPRRPDEGVVEHWLSPSIVHGLAFGVFTLLGAWGVSEYHGVRQQAQAGGVSSRVVSQFYSLPPVPWPSRISENWTVRSTAAFEDAPIQVVEFGDPLCPDCKLLHGQLKRLAQDFQGQINVAFQYFPLEAECNDVVDKDKHPGACEFSYMLSCGGSDFPAMLDEAFENMKAAKDPAWRADFAARWGVSGAHEDPAVRDHVLALVRTGAEYEKTHADFDYGIRSTPTMIINNRMVIGTLPYEQLRAIFQALVDEHERGGAGFLENWVET